MCYTGKCPYEKFLPKEQDCICLAPKDYCWFDEELEEINKENNNETKNLYKME